MIWWNGVSSDDLGLYVEHYPMRKLPARKTIFFSLPNRTGDFVLQKDAFENYIQAYDIYISAEQRKLPNAMVAINAWLYGADGYAKLEDSYDLDTYRMAVFEGGQDVENMLNRFGRATIEFNCKPQRWLTSGEDWIDLAGASFINPLIVKNPTGLPSKPLIQLNASGYISITAATTTSSSTYLSNANNIQEIDCEAETLYGEEAYDPYTQNGNVNFLTIPTGDDVRLYYSGSNVTSIKLKPRWYAL